MSIDDLRAAALARNAARRFRMAVCLDDDYRARLEEARKAADAEASQAAKASGTEGKGAGRRRLADQPGSPAADAYQRLADTPPAESTIVCTWKPLTPAGYQAVLDDNADARGNINIRAVYEAVLSDCWAGCETVDGDPVDGLDWEQVRDGCLTSMDYDTAAAGVVALHRSGTTIPFTRASCGSAVRS